MADYLKFLDALYGATKKMRIDGAASIAKHLKNPERSPFFASVIDRQPEVEFLTDALHMVVSDLSLDELTFYLDGYRSRLVAHEKADVHLVNLIFRTVWAIGHSGWDALQCTEYGRAVIPRQHSLTREQWIKRCNDMEIERTQTRLDWGAMLDEIKQAGGRA